MQACPVQPQWKRPFSDRLIAALRLDQSVFEEVEHDRDAMGQAAAVIFLASFAQGLGAIEARSIPALLGALTGFVFAGFVGWVIATAVIWVIGVKLMGCTSDFGELLRTMGFASAPKVLFLLGVLPLGVLHSALGVMVLVLTTAASVLAIRHALDVSTARAVGICLLAIAVSVALAIVAATMVGVTLGRTG